MEGAIHIQQPVDRPWLEQLRSRLAELALGYDPVFGEVDLESADLLAALERLGAVSPESLPVTWSFQAGNGNPHSGTSRPLLAVHGARANAFAGAFTFTFHGERYGAAAVGIGHTATTVLAAASLERLAGLVARLREADAAVRRGYLEVYGAEGYGRSLRLPWSVNEDSLILPSTLKREILAYVDAFLGTGSATDHAPSRGVMLLGRPGTGKTLTARHILGRVDGARRYLFVRSTAAVGPFDDRTFERLVQVIEAGTEPAVVLVEDLDRMFDGGATTAQYFLNVLDGLLEPRAPVLWIATSNDPAGIAPNLLDRPGRFDRVFLFPAPDAPERAALFSLYAANPIPGEVAWELAQAADGLTGAHIREVCYGATIRRETDGLPYPEALRVELDRMNEQHRESRDYERSLRGGETVGFGAG